MSDLKKTAIVDLGRFRAFECPDVEASWHNHGAGMIVTACREQGLNVDLIGLKYLNDWEEFKFRIRDYDTVGISMMSSDYSTALQAIDIIKEVNPQAKIIVGGIHVTVSSKQGLDNPKIDHIFYGEGEITFPKLLKEPDKFEREVHGEIVHDLDTLPFLDRTLYPQPLEKNVPFWGASPMASFLTARGCVFNCRFCQPAERNHFGLKVRRRSVSNVIAEIKEVVEKYKPVFLIFHDDHFMFEKVWLEEFVREYAKIRLPFWAATRADFVCDNSLLVYQLRGVGLEVASIGFESGNQRILDMIRKGTTVEQNYRAAEIVGRTGVKIYANIMYGFPGETKEEQKDTRRLCYHIQRVSQAMISPAYFTPYPGNDLGEECIKQGLSLIKENEYYRYGRDKIKGVDYDFLDRLINGQLDSQL
jgi:radical SAM superfamily enzyme YgiQ (UPF0313 family)